VKPLKSLAMLCLALSAFAGLSGCAPLSATGAAVTGDRRTTGTVVEDTQIESKTLDFFNADAQLAQNCHLNVTSYNQRVLLTGECPTEELRGRANEYAGRVAKVREVFNEVVIAAPSTVPQRTNDGLITTKVKTKLYTIKDLSANNVKVVTEAGVVYLLGLVDRASADAAANAAAAVGGVHKVVKLFEYPP
jgi:osmotically-inducible protein OsmY